MAIDWNQVVAEFFGDLPHPKAPQLKVKELATAVKLATRARFGGHASLQEASGFWSEFQSMNQKLQAQAKMPLTPEDFEQTLDRIAPTSFAFHGRPPTMSEIAQHRESSPSDVRKYYGDLPDKHYPDVSAADMAKYLAIAEPFSHQHLDRPPNKLEARRFAHAALGMDAVSSYYRSLKESESGNQDTSDSHGGVPGAGDARRQQDGPRTNDPRLGRQRPASGGQDSVSQGRENGQTG